MRIGTNRHFNWSKYKHFRTNGYMGKMDIESMWELGQMDISGKEHFEAKGRFGTNEYLRKWAVWSKGK